MEYQSPVTPDDFQCWLIEMDEFLEEFAAEFGQSRQSLLDYSADSLKHVEQWILDTYPDTDAMLSDSEKRRVNNVACYIGEVYRKAIGGKWSINLDEPKYAFYGLPLITAVGCDPACPITLATASADRRTGNYLQTVLAAKLRNRRLS